MEDAIVCSPELKDDLSLFAVFDGHGGAEVSNRLAKIVRGHVLHSLNVSQSYEEALRFAILKMDSELLRCNSFGRWNMVGSTAAVTLLTQTTLTVASVGDSRVFLCRDGKCLPLTEDHKPDTPSERKRIEATGGVVSRVGPCWRVDGCLNMSRAMGDFKFKDGKLSVEQQRIAAVPDVLQVEIDEKDEFLLIGCDGLFELMSWESVCGFVRSRLNTQPLPSIAQDLLDACCAQGLSQWGGRGTDNESVVIVRFRAPGGLEVTCSSFSEISVKDPA